MSAATTACDGGQVMLAFGCMVFTTSAVKQQIAFQQLYLNAKNSRGTSGQRDTQHGEHN